MSRRTSVASPVSRSRLLATGMLLLALCTESLAALSTYLEPRLVDEMETVRLTIRADGSGRTDGPDLSPLAEDFEVLGNQTSSRISSINGRTIASVEYQISLRPRRTGELTVPALKVGDEYSEAVRLVVRPLDPFVKETIAGMVFFETELSDNPVYVQGETVLTRRLYYSQGVQIYSDLPGVPELENAVVIPLGETQSRSVLRGTRRYGVIEQRFAIFPEKSGRLTVPAISVTSSVRLQSGGRTRRSGVRVSTEAVELEVMPIPAGYPADAAWLPATDVTLAQQWSPEKNRIDVGEPLGFTVTVRAEGNRGSAIPPIPLPLPPEQFKIYPEAPLVEESSSTGTIVGRRQASYALIPTGPGAVSVPPLRIVWWDTGADQLRETSIDVRSLTVTGTATAPAPVEVLPEPVAEAPAEDMPVARTVSSRRTMLIALGMAAAAVLAVLLATLGRRLLADVLRPLTVWRAPGASPWRLMKALRRAAGRGEPGPYRQALVAYLAAAWELPSEEVLARFREHPGAAALLRDLDTALYAPDAGNRPDLGTLTALARAAARHVREHGVTGTALPPLYG